MLPFCEASSRHRATQIIGRYLRRIGIQGLVGCITEPRFDASSRCVHWLATVDTTEILTSRLFWSSPSQLVPEKAVCKYQSQVVPRAIDLIPKLDAVDREWLAQVRSWIETLLGTARRPTRAIEQFSARPGTLALRLETRDGSAVFFKHQPQRFPETVGLASLLAKAFPQNFIEVIGVESARRWWLTESVGDAALERASTQEACEAALKALCRVGRELECRSADFQSLGVRR